MPTLRLLREFGIDPDAPGVRAAVNGVREHWRWEYAGEPFFDGEVEPRINEGAVAVGAYFGVDVDGVVARLLDEQLADGGWNCEAESGSTRSSFHSTICVLDGLLEYQRAGGGIPVADAWEQAQEYLLTRSLCRRASTGDLVAPEWLMFSFPVQCHYDVLRGFDYFRSLGGTPDTRLDEAVAPVRSKQQPDGRWLLENTHPGLVHFAKEQGDGQRVAGTRCAHVAATEPEAICLRPPPARSSSLQPMKRPAGKFDHVDIDVTSTFSVVIMEWSIQQIARITGTTSRTLRHYDDIGIVAPSRIGTNGYRFYDAGALVRLQRVLLLRELGLGLPQISDILAHHTDETSALTTHLSLLHQEQARLARQIAAVEHTLSSLKGSEPLMPEPMFDGFDHTQYRDEVEQRWGTDAYVGSDAWWREMNDAQRTDWVERSRKLGRDWVSATQTPGSRPDSPQAQDLARQHVEWLGSIPGTPASDPGGDVAAYVRSLAELYVTDERFAANYGGLDGATFVRDALLAYLR